MKYQKLLCAVGVTLAASTANADVLGIFAGAGKWDASPSGDIGRGPISVENELGLESENQNYYYLALEHPIPLIPNIHLQQNDLKFSGAGTINGIKGLDRLPVGGNAVTELDLSHLDATLYYELWDIAADIDAGLTVRVFDGAAAIVSDFGSEDVDLKAVLPMVYAHANIPLPLTGLSVAATVNYTKFDSFTASDLQASVAYTFDLPLLDIGIEAGYKNMALKVDNNDELQADIKVDGPFIGLKAHF